MTVVERLDRAQRDRPALGFPLAVLYKYFDDGGGYLAALIAYYAFVSLFPLLLLATTILGLALSGDPALQQRVIDSALGQIPVIGSNLSSSQKLGGGLVGIVIGALGALYGGLGVAQAVQHAMNTAWMVPRNSRPNPFAARGRSLMLLATVGIAVIATTALSSLGSSTLGDFGVLGRGLFLLASLLLNTVTFTFAFRAATARHLTVSDVLLGAAMAAVAWQLLQTFGVAYVNRVVANASATNSVFALVLGLLAFFYLAATAVVICAQINVVRVDRLWPRALLTPFTDNVTLTGGDRRSYTGQAKATRNKGFQDIDVEYQPSPADASADRRDRPTQD